MIKKRVLIVHNNLDYINKVNQFFIEKDCFTLMDYALDGQMFIKKRNLNSYDIVLVKNALTHITGLYAIENLLKDTEDIPEHIILFTPFINDFVVSKCNEIGISYCKESDIQINKLPDLFLELEFKKAYNNKLYFNTQLEIIKLLKQIGLLRAYLGYTYFEYILNEMVDKAEFIYKPMRLIYEQIASHFNVSNASVEKAMRSCVKSSLQRNNSYYARTIFGHSCEKKEYPSTSIVLRVCIKTLKEQKNIIINNNMKNSLRKI